MKQGDKIQPKPHIASMFGEGERTISYISDSHVLYRSDRDNMEWHLPRHLFDERFELAPDFFEEGARYEHTVSGVRFAVEMVRADDDGARVAFGLWSSPGGQRSDWKAVRANFVDFEREGWRKL